MGASLSINHLIFAVAIVCTLLRPAALSNVSIYCYPGTLLVTGENGEDDHCEPCVEGAFVEHLSHRQTYCEDCTPFYYHSPYFELVANCTPHSDTKIKCKSPSYFFSHESRNCIPCRDCRAEGMHLGLECSDYQNAVCCPREGMAVMNGNCVDVIYCGPQQYLSTKHGFGKETCATCPDGFTNYPPVHRMQTCKNRCVPARPDEPNTLMERHMRCRPSECEMGRSCTAEDGVVCAPCLSRTTAPPTGDNNIYLVKERKDRLAKLKGDSKINKTKGGGSLQVFKLLGIITGLILFTGLGMSLFSKSKI